LQIFSREVTLIRYHFFIKVGAYDTKLAVTAVVVFSRCKAQKNFEQTTRHLTQIFCAKNSAKGVKMQCANLLLIL